MAKSTSKMNVRLDEQTEKAIKKLLKADGPAMIAISKNTESGYIMGGWFHQLN